MPTIQIADSVRVMWCPECDAYHVLLYHNHDSEAFSACTLTPDLMCDIIENDFGVVVEHPKPMMLHS